MRRSWLETWLFLATWYLHFPFQIREKEGSVSGNGVECDIEVSREKKQNKQQKSLIIKKAVYKRYLYKQKESVSASGW